MHVPSSPARRPVQKSAALESRDGENIKTPISSKIVKMSGCGGWPRASARGTTRQYYFNLTPKALSLPLSRGLEFFFLDSHNLLKCSSYIGSSIVVLQEIARFIRVYSYLQKIYSAFTCFDRSIYTAIGSGCTGRRRLRRLRYSERRILWYSRRRCL